MDLQASNPRSLQSPRRDSRRDNNYARQNLQAGEWKHASRSRRFQDEDIMATCIRHILQAVRASRIGAMWQRRAKSTFSAKWGQKHGGNAQMESKMHAIENSMANGAQHIPHFDFQWGFSIKNWKVKDAFSGHKRMVQVPKNKILKRNCFVAVGKIMLPNEGGKHIFKKLAWCRMEI